MIYRRIKYLVSFWKLSFKLMSWCLLLWKVMQSMPGYPTIVGANAFVTHSFETGNVVIAGAPAKIIRTL